MGSTNKAAKRKARIAELERKLREALAGQVHTYHFADAGLRKAGRQHLGASGVVLTMTVLGGRELFPPTLLRDGLSEELIAALRADLKYSYDLATSLKVGSAEEKAAWPARPMEPKE